MYDQRCAVNVVKPRIVASLINAKAAWRIIMTNKSNFWTDSDIGLLIIRIGLGGIIFFHGFHKLMHGLEDQIQILASHGFSRLANALRLRFRGFSAGTDCPGRAHAAFLRIDHHYDDRRICSLAVSYRPRRAWCNEY